MKYYPKCTNTKTGMTFIIPIPCFTNKRKAVEWANKFMEVQPNSKVVIVDKDNKEV